MEAFMASMDTPGDCQVGGDATDEADDWSCDLADKLPARDPERERFPVDVLAAEGPVADVDGGCGGGDGVTVNVLRRDDLPDGGDRESALVAEN